MGLKNRDINKQYVRVKDGKFFLGKDLETPYEELEGKITALYYKDEEFEGSPLRKLIVVLQDGEDNYQLGLNVETPNYSTLVSFLKNVDVTRTLTLHPKMDSFKKDGIDVTRRSILVSQDGKFAKSYFTKDENHGLPKWEVVTVGKKKVTDKSAYLDYLEKFVTTDLISKIQPEDAKPSAKPQREKEPVEAEDPFPTTNDLPWDE